MPIDEILLVIQEECCGLFEYHKCFGVTYATVVVKFVLATTLDRSDLLNGY
jgi:hypothetical protein